MFKKKLPLSTVSENLSRHWLISTSLILSLTASTAYSVPPTKGEGSGTASSADAALPGQQPGLNANLQQLSLQPEQGASANIGEDDSVDGRLLDGFVAEADGFWQKIIRHF
ncbi:hypothetical protein EZMO1_1190 [Endozoicomonas montiporae CL-33]|uniref:Uncharacterized protein n=1 Tax=Endozoicomonas montiporae CL-33 TaxID=570277 RepID=A0A142B9F9_9GAMM|nr:hypothetical protein EZMO1_1190 [Endozoicomonas montiporae CL-33]